MRFFLEAGAKNTIFIEREAQQLCVFVQGGRIAGGGLAFLWRAVKHEPGDLKLLECTKPPNRFFSTVY